MPNLPGHGLQPHPGLPHSAQDLLLGEEESPLPTVTQLKGESVLDPGVLVGPVQARPRCNVNHLKNINIKSI